MFYINDYLTPQMKDGVLDLDGVMAQLNNAPENIRKHMIASLNNCKDKGNYTFS